MHVIMKKAEQKKNTEYRERILQVEHASFSPLVFSTTGSLGPQATIVTKRLSERLAERQNLPYSVVAGWVRCRLAFAILRCSLVCLRGSRPFRKRELSGGSQILLAVQETELHKEDAF